METSAESETQPEEAKTAAAETAEKGDELTENQSPVAAKKKRRSRERKPKKAGRKSGKGKPSLRQVAERFAACGRCSYFWAGYRVLFGESGQEAAVAEGDAGWLELDWNLQMFELLYKSYGIRIDVGHFHYEGCCKECRRRFVYQAAEEEDELSSCAIEISPRSAR